MITAMLPGFLWEAVNWGGPDEPRSEFCSYCGDEIPEESVPLILWNADGWMAQFCDHCQAAWWGIETFPDPPDDLEDPALDFGPCCMCETTGGVRNVGMLSFRAAVAGHGWGCLTCGLPNDGAMVVLCDPCKTKYEADPSLLKTACRGYPATDGRISISELSGNPFEHDMSKH